MEQCMTEIEVFRMARQSGIDSVQQYDSDASPIELLNRFAECIAQHEREACAKVCEDLSKDMTPIAEQAVKTCVTFIRGRT
jgi:hypothetical protein